MPKITNPYDHAIFLLARREQSTKELTDKLSRKGYSDDDIHHALAQLREEKLQSDERFVASMIRQRISQGKGPRYIQQELSQHHIPSTLIHTAMDNAEVDWGELAYQVRVSRFGDAPPEDFPAKAKQMRFLQNRGFDPGHIRLALEPKDAI